MPRKQPPAPLLMPNTFRPLRGTRVLNRGAWKYGFLQNLHFTHNPISIGSESPAGSVIFDEEGSAPEKKRDSPPSTREGKLVGSGSPWLVDLLGPQSMLIIDFAPLASWRSVRLCCGKENPQAAHGLIAGCLA